MSDPRKEKVVTGRGIVTEALPSTLFRVKLDGKTDEDQKEILAYLGGKMRMHRIKVLIGDSVEIVYHSACSLFAVLKKLKR